MRKTVKILNWPVDWVKHYTARKNSLLFVLVIAVFLTLLFSASLYIVTSEKLISVQVNRMAVDGLIQTLSTTSIAADNAIAAGLDDSNVIATFSQPCSEDTYDSPFIPFIINDHDLELINTSRLPADLAERLTRTYKQEDYIIHELSARDTFVMLAQIDSDGHVWLTGSVKMPHDGRFFGYARDITTIINGSKSIEKLLAGALALGYLVFFGLLLVILKVVTNPIRKLTNAVKCYALGDFSHRVNIPTGITEIGVLTEAFNHMGEELRHQQFSLESYSRKLEEANKKSNDLVSKLSRRHHEQRAMLEASITASRLETPEDVFMTLMQSLYDDLDLKYIAFFLPELAGNFRMIQSVGLDNTSEIKLESERIDCMFASLQSMEPLLVHLEGDISGMDATSENAINPVIDYTRMYDRLYIPISTGDNKIGVLELSAGSEKAFDNATIRHLRHFTSHMEVILRNKALFREAKQRTRELERINKISRAIAGELDMDILIRDVVEFTQNTIPSTCSFIGLINGPSIEIHHVSPGTAYIDEWVIDISSDGHLKELADGISILQNDLMIDPRVKTGGFIETNALRSFVGCPIKTKDEVLGVICGFSPLSNAFSRSDLNFLTLLAGQVAIAMQNATMFEEILAKDSRRDYQLSMAQKLQENRVPSYFKQNVVAVRSKLQAADELSGDFCDVFSLGRNSIALIVGDVANKGVAASLMAFSLLSMFRNVAKTLKPPCEIMESINRSLISQIKEDGWFATGFYGRLNTSTGTLTYSSAGHEQPIWYHADTGKAEKLEAVGYPLGLFKSFPYETREIQLKQGDRLILYTDGVTDASNTYGERFGHKKLLDLIGNSGDIPCEKLNDKLIDAVMEFSNGQKQKDDIILVVTELQDDPWINHTIIFPESSQVIDEVLEALQAYELDQKTTYSIRLALDEAIANAWRHGLNQDNNTEFNVSYYLADDGFRLRVKDAGAGFDHEALPDPTVEENLFKSHGRGVFLIRQMIDEVEFNDSGNEISMLKRFETTVDDDESVLDSMLLERMVELNKQKESLDDAKAAKDAILAQFDFDDN